MTPDIRLTDAALRLSPALETRFASSGSTGEITGIAAGYGDHLVDCYGSTIAPGAFAESLADHKARGTSPAMLWAHDPKEPVGVWDELKETAKGLMVKGRINLETQRGREAHSLLKQGAFQGLSIGFNPQERERRKDGGDRFSKADLWEVSLVTFPARKEARVTEVRSVCDLERPSCAMRASPAPQRPGQRPAAGLPWRSPPTTSAPTPSAPSPLS